MGKKIVVKIGKLHDGAHRQAGSFDRASRWYPDAEYRIPGSFSVRGPSRAWPYSYLKHFYSIKYARLLFTYNPRLYLQLQGIAEESEQGKAVIAAHIAKRMEVAA